MTLTEDQRKSGGETLTHLLKGSQLDSFRVHSTELAIGFFGGGVPSIWLSTRQAVSVDSSSIQKCVEGSEFFDQRRQVLGDLHRLIGEYVELACIDVSGDLVVEFENGTRLVVATDDEEDEVLWSVTSDTPSPFAVHDWAVSLLTKKDQLVVRTPR